MSSRAGSGQLRVAYRAKGTLVSQNLAQTLGVSTPQLSDDRYSGPLSVNVTHVNHHAQTGLQDYTLINARVHFADADHNHVVDTPKAGDRVKLKGTITVLARRCDHTGFTPTIVIKKVRFKPAPTA